MARNQQETQIDLPRSSLGRHGIGWSNCSDRTRAPDGQEVELQPRSAVQGDGRPLRAERRHFPWVVVTYSVTYLPWDTVTRDETRNDETIESPCNPGRFLDLGRRDDTSRYGSW